MNAEAQRGEDARKGRETKEGKGTEFFASLRLCAFAVTFLRSDRINAPRRR